jgi:hypothetical protein
LTSANEEIIEVEVDGKPYALPLATIDIARLVPDGA